MSRSGYGDDCSGAELVLWRGAVSSALYGRRGQAYLREMAAALDAMPEKRLIPSALVCEDGCCAMGSVALARGQDVAGVDAHDRDWVAKVMGIAPAMAAEIAFENDEGYSHAVETPEQRWQRMRRWVDRHIIPGPEGSDDE